MPNVLTEIARSAKRAIRFQQNRFRSNGSIFNKIYKTNRWGGSRGEIYSGWGSDEKASALYAEAVLSFLAEIRCSSVVDIGCGDFRIGSKIAYAVGSYIGADASRLVIERNVTLFENESVKFIVCDAEADPLPSGNVCLIRQVLQHLSNASIKRILHRLINSYRYIIITEHLPSPTSFKGCNFDKPTGDDVRAYRGSGVYVDKPPFNVPVQRTLLDVEVADGDHFVTLLVSGTPNPAEAG